jgi:hypothetical protein
MLLNRGCAKRTATRIFALEVIGVGAFCRQYYSSRVTNYNTQSTVLIACPLFNGKRKNIDSKMNYNAIEIGENDTLIQVGEQQQLFRRRALGWSVFVVSMLVSFVMVSHSLSASFKPKTTFLSAEAQWSDCASYSLAECCDCGKGKLVAGQCWEGFEFTGMRTCARGCCLGGFIDTCNPVDMAITASVFAAIGAGLVAGGFAVAGLGTLGPVAGGLFAGAQGAGVAAGSLMATAQSAAMTGTGVGVGAGVGAVTGALAACLNKSAR